MGEKDTSNTQERTSKPKEHGRKDRHEGRIERLRVQQGGEEDTESLASQLDQIDKLVLRILVGKFSVGEILDLEPPRLRKLSVEQNILETAPVRCALAIFQVLKKNGKARLVIESVL